jgi:acetylornithine deacetylase/succinyl-diaminopimelate desuccinylase-like protein
MAHRVRALTLCAALTLQLASGLAITRAARAGEEPGDHQRLALALFRELIEIDTTHSTGNTTRAATTLAAHLWAAGFAEEDAVVLEEVPGKGNLVARLRGSDSGVAPILLLAHLDVVEADPADWSVDPFRFLERDGYYWGRGTTDDKDECAIHVANLIRWKQEGFVPARDIVVALTADEEAGQNNGVVWLLAQHRDRIDAAFALNEGGGGAMKDGRRVQNSVQASEKIYQTFELEVTDPGGHSSLPRAENAIYRLSRALLAIEAHSFPVRLNDVTRVFFERSAALHPPELAAAMRGILSNPPDPDAVATLSAMPVYNARIRTTCVATQVEAGHAENALPQRAHATVNCRILPDGSQDELETQLRAVVADPQVTLRRLQDAHSIKSPASPLTPEVLGAIERTTEELWPGVPVIPTMSTGATDGLFLRNAGIPVYGVSGIFNDIDDIRAHGRDERILIRSFFEGQEFLYRLVKRLSSPSTGADGQPLGGGSAPIQ